MELVLPLGLSGRCGVRVEREEQGSARVQRAAMAGRVKDRSRDKASAGAGGGECCELERNA